MRIARLPAFAAGMALIAGVQLSVPAAASAPLVIGVDHADFANQQPFPPFNRLFEYTDFFSRQVTIHTGDTIDFRSAPGSFHIVALARTELWARSTYPVALADNDGSGATDIATGSGTNKVVFGPSNFPIVGGSHHGGGTIFFNNGFGPPVCGVALLRQAPCTFSGGQDVEILGPEIGVDFTTGNLGFADQLVNINAQPGRYHYFCYIHPGMRGVLDVVGNGAGTSTQADIDAASNAQFASDQAQGLAAEAQANQVQFTGGAPGTRTYTVKVGTGAADDHVAIDEMFPSTPLNLAPGDSVQYVWMDPHNVHSVAFPAGNPSLPEPFGFDCGASYNGIPMTPGPPPICLEPGDTTFEVIGDPGNAAPGTALSDPSVIVDAGVLLGTAYGVSPSTQSWSLTTNGTTKSGAYEFQCTIHDWMHGTLNVGA
jgi:plastocyanin